MMLASLLVEGCLPEASRRWSGECGARRHGFAARPSGGASTAGRHYDRLPSSMIPRARGRGPRRPDRPGSGGLQRDNVPTRDYCPPTSPVRGEAAQSRHGGRSVRVPHFGLPDRHSCERPPPLRLKSAGGSRQGMERECHQPGAAPLAGTRGRAHQSHPPSRTARWQVARSAAGATGTPATPHRAIRDPASDSWRASAMLNPLNPRWGLPDPPTKAPPFTIPSAAGPSMRRTPQAAETRG
jgi:hypothetical protein